MWSDLIQLIPQNLKQQALDALVDVVSEQAEGVGGNKLANKVKKLRSDAAFRVSFEQGLGRALKRFIGEYELEDEDLVATIASEQGFFQNKEIQTALIAILKQPGAYLDVHYRTVLK